MCMYCEAGKTLHWISAVAAAELVRVRLICRIAQRQRGATLDTLCQTSLQ